MRSTLLAIVAAWVAASSAWALTSDEENSVAIYRRLNAGVVNITNRAILRLFLQPDPQRFVRVRFHPRYPRAHPDQPPCRAGSPAAGGEPRRREQVDGEAGWRRSADRPGGAADQSPARSADRPAAG